MKVKTLIKKLQRMNPEAEVKLNNYGGEKALFVNARKNDENTVWLDGEKDIDMQEEINARFEAAVNGEWDSDLDFYMDLLETGIDIEMVRKYMGDEPADHMRQFCEEHGLIPCSQKTNISSGINIKTKEDVLALNAAMDQLEKRIKEIAKYLGYIDNVWHFESMSIGKNNIYITTYDLYYDLHDTKTGSFPIECLFDDELLKNHKQWLEEEEKARELREQQEKQQRQEEKERAEYERLKEKFESEPEAEPEQEM